MFGIFKLATNAVEGVAQVALGTVKAAVGVVAIPLDDGKIFDDAGKNIRDGVSKIGSSK
mgnify:CR=1 FL=1